MRTLLVILILLAAAVLAPDVRAQKRTIETRTPIDSTTTLLVSETVDITPRNHALVVNPLRFFVLYNLAYYQRVSPHLALGAGLQIPAFDEIDGVIVQAEARFHPGREALKGFYIAPNLWLNSLSDDHDGMLTELGLIAGWQWFTGKDFAIGFGLGAAFELTDERDRFEVYDTSRPVIRFNIGYAF